MTRRIGATKQVTAVGEAASWILIQPSSPTVIYEICSDSYYGIDEVEVLIGTQSSRIRNRTPIYIGQWMHLRQD